jgi:hypothetical protein
MQENTIFARFFFFGWSETQVSHIKTGVYIEDIPEEAQENI